MDNLSAFFEKYKKEVFFILYALLAMNIAYVIYTDYTNRQIANKVKEQQLKDLLIRAKEGKGNTVRYNKTIESLEELKGRPLNEDDLKKSNSKPKPKNNELEEH